MNVKTFKEYRKGLASKEIGEIQSILNVIGEAFQFTPGTFLDQKMLREAEITLNDIYKEIYKNRKKEVKLTPAMEDELDNICSYASDMLDMLKSGRKGKVFYKDAKVLGKMILNLAKRLGVYINWIVMTSSAFI